MDIPYRQFWTDDQTDRQTDSFKYDSHEYPNECTHTLIHSYSGCCRFCCTKLAQQLFLQSKSESKSESELDFIFIPLLCSCRISLYLSLSLLICGALMNCRKLNIGVPNRMRMLYLLFKMLCN